MSTQVYDHGVLRQSWDDSTRTYTEYDETGVPIVERPYTEEENLAADDAAASALEDSNKRTVEEALAQDFEAMQAILNQTNADLRADPAQEIKDIARAVRRLTRIALGDYDGTE